MPFPFFVNPFRSKSMNQNEYYINKFIRAKAGRRPRTVETYRVNLKRYVEFAGSSWPPTPDLLADYIAWLQSDERELQDGTIAAYYRAVRTWINWLVNTEVLAKNPLKHIDEPQPPKKRVPKAPPKTTTEKFFNQLEAEIEFDLRMCRIVKSWMKVRDFTMVSFMLGTGGRISETCALRLSDFNLEHHTVIFRETKNGYARKVPFSKNVAGDLKMWLEVRSKLDISTRLNHAFVSEYHGKWRPLSASGFRQAHRRRCENLRVPYFNPHSLRHAHAIRSLEKGASLADIRDRLGHRSVKTTDIYLIPANLDFGGDETSPR